MYICVFFVVLLTLSATVHCTSYMLLVVCSQSVQSSQNDASTSLLMLCVIGEGVTMALDDYGLCILLQMSPDILVDMCSVSVSLMLCLVA